MFSMTLLNEVFLGQLAEEDQDDEEELPSPGLIKVNGDLPPQEMFLEFLKQEQPCLHNELKEIDPSNEENNSLFDVLYYSGVLLQAFSQKDERDFSEFSGLSKVHRAWSRVFYDLGIAPSGWLLFYASCGITGKLNDRIVGQVIRRFLSLTSNVVSNATQTPFIYESSLVAKVVPILKGGSGFSKTPPIKFEEDLDIEKNKDRFSVVFPEEVIRKGRSARDRRSEVCCALGCDSPKRRTWSKDLGFCGKHEYIFEDCGNKMKVLMDAFKEFANGRELLRYEKLEQYFVDQLLLKGKESKEEKNNHLYGRVFDEMDQLESYCVHVIRHLTVVEEAEEEDNEDNDLILRFSQIVDLIRHWKSNVLFYYCYLNPDWSDVCDFLLFQANYLFLEFIRCSKFALIPLAVIGVATYMIIASAVRVGGLVGRKLPNVCLKPFTDDYIPRKLKNFTIGLAVGGVTGMAVGYGTDKVGKKSGSIVGAVVGGILGLLP